MRRERHAIRTFQFRENCSDEMQDMDQYRGKGEVTRLSSDLQGLQIHAGRFLAEY